MIPFSCASLVQGKKRYAIDRSDDSSLPDFDMSDIASTVKKTLAILTRIHCGQLPNPEVKISPDGGFAKLYGNGYSVTWGNTKLLHEKLPLDTYKKLMAKKAAEMIKIKYSDDTLG
jgi:hypothetical protein